MPNSSLEVLGDQLAWESGPQNVVMPQPAQGSASPGVQGCQHASTAQVPNSSEADLPQPALGIHCPGGFHASACLGICTLT